MINYDSDNENENSINDIYDAEEVSRTRFNIVLCELYNNKIHGIPPLISNVKTHYMVIYRFKTLDMPLINDILYDVNTEYLYLENYYHKIFNNYEYIVRQSNYIKPEIAECIYLETNELVAIIKTFWIKIIQRKWKKIYKERQLIIQKRCNYASIMYREIYGKWPNDCLYYPSIKGMLSLSLSL
jgi:hypothetical protein